MLPRPQADGVPSLYICPNPANGHLFVAGGACHTIWDEDPVAKTATVWLSNPPDPQQMTFSEDGQMLFVAQATVGSISINLQ